MMGFPGGLVPPVPQPIPVGTAKRVSITFKVAKGWRGTKSRDFPGRTFEQKDRDILQEWARHFRRGDSLHQQTPDLRQVEASGQSKRRKPYLGTGKVTRTQAFFWFRDTQDRLVNSSEKMKDVDVNHINKCKVQSITPNIFIDKNIVTANCSCPCPVSP